jgi:hypothetical protein
MAEQITYPEGSYGIMPNDAFNKYLRFSNQRKAATGITPPYSDKKAFWEGTMDSVVKNASTRAAQNLENRRFESNVGFQNKQLELQDEASKRGMVGGLAQIPLTYMMYDALGLSREKTDPVTGLPIKGKLDRFGNWISEGWDKFTGIPPQDAWQPTISEGGGSMVDFDSGISTGGGRAFDSWGLDLATNPASDYWNMAAPEMATGVSEAALGDFMPEVGAAAVSMAPEATSVFDWDSLPVDWSNINPIEWGAF